MPGGRITEGLAAASLWFVGDERVEEATGILAIQVRIRSASSAVSGLRLPGGM